MPFVINQPVLLLSNKEQCFNRAIVLHLSRKMNGNHQSNHTGHFAFELSLRRVAGGTVATQAAKKKGLEYNILQESTALHVKLLVRAAPEEHAHF